MAATADIGLASIPEFGDAPGLRAAASSLTTETGTIERTAQSVSTTWQGLGAHYHAPESPELLAAIKPGETDAGSINSDARGVADALNAFASTIDDLNRRKAELASQFATLSSTLSQKAHWWQFDWHDDHPELAAQESALQGQVAQLKADWEAAQSTCVAALGGKFSTVKPRPGTNVPPATPRPPEPPAAPKPPEKKGWGPFPPWPDNPVQSLKNAASSTWNGLTSVAGGFVDGAKEMANGFMDMTGLHGWDTAKATWGGMATLGKTAFTAVNPWADETARADARKMMVEVGKQLIDLETWKTDPARAFGKTLFNVASLAVGGGAGAALKGATTAARVASTATKANAAVRAVTAATRLTEQLASAPLLAAATRGAVRITQSRPVAMATRTAKTVSQSAPVRAVNNLPPVRVVRSANTVVSNRIENAAASATRRVLGVPGDGGAGTGAKAATAVRAAEAVTTDRPTPSTQRAGADGDTRPATQTSGARPATVPEAVDKAPITRATAMTPVAESAAKAPVAEPGAKAPSAESGAKAPLTESATRSAPADQGTSRPAGPVDSATAPSRQSAAAAPLRSDDANPRPAATHPEPEQPERAANTATPEADQNAAAKPAAATPDREQGAAPKTGAATPDTEHDPAAKPAAAMPDAEQPAAPKAGAATPDTDHNQALKTAPVAVGGDSSAPRPTSPSMGSDADAGTTRPTPVHPEVDRPGQQPDGQPEAAQHPAQTADDQAASKPAAALPEESRTPAAGPDGQGKAPAVTAAQLVPDESSPAAHPGHADAAEHPGTEHPNEAHQPNDANHPNEADHDTVDNDEVEHHAADDAAAAAHGADHLGDSTPDADNTPDADATDATEQAPVDQTVRTLTDEQIDAIHAESFETAGGRAYYSNDPDTAAVAKALEPVPGHHTVDMHGRPDAVYHGDTQLTAKDLAEVIRRDPNYREGTPVFLMSCETGQGPSPLASALAKELDVKVTAPDQLAWSALDNGKPWAASATPDGKPTWPADGAFHDFQPDGSVEKTALDTGELVDGDASTDGIADDRPVEAQDGLDASDAPPAVDRPADAVSRHHPEFIKKFTDDRLDGKPHHPDDPPNTYRHTNGRLHMLDSHKYVTDGPWHDADENPKRKVIDHLADAGEPTVIHEHDPARADALLQRELAPTGGEPTPEQLQQKAVADLTARIRDRTELARISQEASARLRFLWEQANATFDLGLDPRKPAPESLTDFSLTALPPRALRELTWAFQEAGLSRQALGQASERMGLSGAQLLRTMQGEHLVPGTGLPGAGAGRFDAIGYRVTGEGPDRVLALHVYEAKGGAGELGSRGLTDGTRAGQGSHEYLVDVLGCDPAIRKFLDSNPELLSGRVELRYSEVRVNAKGTTAWRPFGLKPFDWKSVITHD